MESSSPRLCQACGKFGDPRSLRSVGAPSPDTMSLAGVCSFGFPRRGGPSPAGDEPPPGVPARPWGGLEAARALGKAADLRLREEERADRLPRMPTP
jgi:hypothetical protein